MSDSTELVTREDAGLPAAGAIDELAHVGDRRHRLRFAGDCEPGLGDGGTANGSWPCVGAP